MSTRVQTVPGITITDPEWPRIVFPDTTTAILADFDSHTLDVADEITSWPQSAGSNPGLNLAQTNATVSRRPDVVVDDEAGKAVQFTSADQQYIRTNPDLASPVTGPVTVALRVKATTLVNGFLFATQASTNLNCDITSSGAVRMGGGSATAELSAAAAVSAGAWVNVTCVFNGANSRLYVNGVLVASGAVSAGQINRLTVASNTSIGAAFFNGRMRRIRVYGRALAAADVAALHTQWAA